ncbi:MAG: PAS domain S-box protein [Ignavibacteria bacterium]|nr:MAG: PAS domain S-box protein [Ignavibacteria bacterium]
MAEETDNTVKKLSAEEEISSLKKKLAELEKKNQEYFKQVQQWESFLKNTEDGLVVMDNLKIVDCNPKALEFFKVTKDEFIGKSPIHFSPKFQEDGSDSRAKAIELQKGLRTDKSVSFEWLFKRKNGTTFYALVTLTRIPQLGPNFVQALIKDIHDLKIAQYELKQSEDRYKNIVENASEIIVRLDPVWKFIFVNKTFSMLLKYGEQELFGRDFFSIIPKSHRDKIQKKLTDPGTTGGISYFEIPLKSSDGRLLWFAVYKKTIIKNDRVYRIQLSGLNITEKKKLEDMQGVFFQISETLLKPIKLNDLYPLIHEQVAKLIPAKNFYIALVDDEREMISFPYFIDQYDQPPTPRKLGRGLTEYVLRTGKPLLATKENYMQLADKGEIELIGEFSVDWLGVPLKAQDKTIGVIAVQSYDKEIRYDETSKDILSYVSTQIALAIERKKSEQEIEESLSLLQTTVESTADGILVVGNDGIIKLYNQKFLDIWGIPEDLLKEKEDSVLISYVHDQLKDPVGFLRRVNMLYELPEETGWDILEFKDGRIFERYTQPQYLNGKIIGRVWSFRDITEQKEAEKKIEYERYLLHMLMDNIPDTIYFKDKDCKFIRINKAQVKVLGVLREEDAIGKTDFDFFDEESALEAFNDEMRIFKTGKPIINKEEKITKPGKPPKWYSATKVPIYDDMGNITGLVGISRDITQMKETEERLRQYSEELKELNATKDRFMSIIAHDLKSPFGTLLGFLELLREDFDELAREELKNFITMSHESAKKIFNLLQNLLEWAYMQKGQIKFDPIDLILKSFADEAVEVLLDRAKEKGIKIKNEIDSSLKIKADKSMIQTVIRNITNNALKFTDSGGSITLHAEKVDDYVKIGITDTGIGMDEETKNKLFKLDTHHTTKGTQGESGTGLGLIICKEMVEKNSGEIWVESKPGEGTTFYFTVPSAD